MTIMTRTLNQNQTHAANPAKTIKFLYSYGGRIVPRRADGKLRYVGGFTRVLAIDRSVSYAELMVKFGELCGESMNLKCKLPSEDLDLLVSVKSDDDLANVIHEYEKVPGDMQKIRAVLFPIKSLKKISPPMSPVATDNPKPRVGGGCYWPSPCTAAYQYNYSYNPVQKAAAAAATRNNTYRSCYRFYNQQECSRDVYYVPYWDYSQ